MSETSFWRRALPALLAAAVLLVLVVVSVVARRSSSEEAPAASKATPAASARPSAAAAPEPATPPPERPGPSRSEDSQADPSGEPPGDHSDQKPYPVQEHRPELPPPSEPISEEEIARQKAEEPEVIPTTLEQKIERTRHWLPVAERRAALLEKEAKEAEDRGDTALAAKKRVALRRLKSRMAQYEKAIEEGRDPHPEVPDE